jgi:nickel-dependent lactate racemase
MDEIKTKPGYYDFDRSLIAPCGMNCGTCIGYLREKNKCPGCRTYSADKAVSVRRCIIIKCVNLEKTTSKFCYECEKYPCKRLKQLDKRYRTKYKTSFIENLAMIKEKGIDSFLAFESERRTCPHCGSVLSVHRENCLICAKN